MKEMLFEFPTDWEEWVMFILCWIVFLFISLVLIAGIMYALNFWFMPDKYKEGRIVGKTYHPAYVSYGVISTGKTTVIYPIYHHESWSVKIEIDSETDNVSVGEMFYQSTYKGQEVRATYQQGRFWGGINIKDFIELR